MRVGFTGTREGLTEQQSISFAHWFNDKQYLIDSFSHGCCVGADTTAVQIVYQHQKGPQGSKYDFPVFALPCTLWKFVSREAWELSTEVAFPEDALDRNKKIVENSDLLLACPKGPQELRSGTWYTVQFARKQHKPVVVFWPDGTVTEEENK